MTTKTITFCDVCNGQCIVTLDRRSSERPDSVARREGDYLGWIEGEGESIHASGWLITKRKKHICPRCYVQHKDAVFTI